MKIVTFLEDSSLLPEAVSETIQNEVKERRGGFLSMLLGTLSASLLGNILTVKGAIAKSVSKDTQSKRQGRGINRAGEGILRAGYENKEVKNQEKKDKIMKTKLIFNAASSFNYFGNTKVLSK